MTARTAPREPAARKSWMGSGRTRPLPTFFSFPFRFRSGRPSNPPVLNRLAAIGDGSVTARNTTASRVASRYFSAACSACQNFALARVSDATARDKPHGTPQPTRVARHPYKGWSLLAAGDASSRVWPRAAQAQGLSGKAVAAFVARPALDANQKCFGGTMFAGSLAGRHRQRSKFSSGDGKVSAHGVHTHAH